MTPFLVRGRQSCQGTGYVESETSQNLNVRGFGALPFCLILRQMCLGIFWVSST